MVALALGLALPRAVAADGAGSAVLVVPVDHLEPGATFPLSARDVGGGITAVVSLVNGETQAELGRVTTGASGELSATLLVPSTFPAGYAQLRIETPSGDLHAIWVLVGDRAATVAVAPDWPAVAIGVAVLAFAGVLIGWFVVGRRSRTAE